VGFRNFEEDTTGGLKGPSNRGQKLRGQGLEVQKARRLKYLGSDDNLTEGIKDTNEEYKSIRQEVSRTLVPK